MEGFTKIPNEIYELELNPNEFFVLAHLLRIKSYREFKGEVEDGWFAKSKNELAKECGFGSHNRLNRVLQGMSKMNIVQIRPTNSVTYFKLSMSKMDIVQNEHMSKMSIPTMSKTDIDSMSKMDNLHNNSNKNKEQEYTNTSTSINNNIEHNEKTYLEKEKEEYDIACNTSSKDENEVEVKGSKIKEILDSFKNGDNTRFPTMDELRAIFIKENINFTDDDFKSNSSGMINGKYKLSPRNAAGAVNKYIRKPIMNYGFWYDSDNKDIQNAVISYIKKKKLNVVIGNNY